MEVYVAMEASRNHPMSPLLSKGEPQLGQLGGNGLFKDKSAFSISKKKPPWSAA